MATLMRREREFCTSDLLSGREESDRPVAPVRNLWQWRSRVMSESLTFTGGEGEPSPAGDR